MANRTCLLQHFFRGFVIQVCQSNIKLVTDKNKCTHFFFGVCDWFSSRWTFLYSVVDSEHAILMIVALFLLIIAIRKAQRLWFLPLYLLRKRREHKIAICSPCKEDSTAENTESSFCMAKKSRLGIAQTTRLVWRDVSEPGHVFLVEKWPPYFKETYCYICQMLGPDLTTQNTHLRRAIPLTKRVNYIIKLHVWDGGALKWKESRVQNAPPASTSQLVISEHILE